MGGFGKAIQGIGSIALVLLSNKIPSAFENLKNNFLIFIGKGSD
jgi:hypothetical protein